jgi:hypothetical protein
MFYADLANALNHGTLDLSEVAVASNHPDLFTATDGELFLPYQPMPGILLMPIVAVWGTGLTQLTFSMMLGAINVVLFWYVLRLLNVSRETKLLLIPFFAFGTAHFYSATTGSLWFYNHVTARLLSAIGDDFPAAEGLANSACLMPGGGCPDPAAHRARRPRLHLLHGRAANPRPAR